ncbi:MAG: hypothetical protein ACHQD8_05295 [Chitinophagales bacterium]
MILRYFAFNQKMMLRKSISGIGLILWLLLSFSCNSSKHSGKSQASLPGTWQTQPVIIDGDSKEWPSPYPNYDSKAMVAYSTSNDRQNLYITMETGDEMTQMKILKQGMTIMIDTNGRKDPQFKINYPMQNDNDPLEMAKEDNVPHKENKPYTTHNWDKKISKSAGEANQYSLEGFNLCNGGYLISQTTACGIKMKLGIDEYKELIVEIMIPFKAIYNKNVITAADAGHPISVCFAVKGFKAPSTKSTDNTNTGSNTNMGGVGMNSGMGGRGGGGHGGGRGGGHSSTENPKQHLYESTKTWKHFGLAYQP